MNMNTLLNEDNEGYSWEGDYEQTWYKSNGSASFNSCIINTCLINTQLFNTGSSLFRWNILYHSSLKNQKMREKVDLFYQLFLPKMLIRVCLPLI